MCATIKKSQKKITDRVARWSRVGGGMQYAALAYNVFALSTLLYVAQLEYVPHHVLQTERAGCENVTGPG